MAENSVASSEGHATHRKLLVGIIIAVILGTILGGFAPEVGKKFSIFGEVFLRLKSVGGLVRFFFRFTFYV